MRTRSRASFISAMLHSSDALAFHAKLKILVNFIRNPVPSNYILFRIRYRSRPGQNFIDVPGRRMFTAPMETGLGVLVQCIMELQRNEYTDMDAFRIDFSQKLKLFTDSLGHPLISNYLEASNSPIYKDFLARARIVDFRQVQPLCTPDPYDSMNYPEILATLTPTNNGTRPTGAATPSVAIVSPVNSSSAGGVMSNGVSIMGTNISSNAATTTATSTTTSTNNGVVLVASSSSMALAAAAAAAAAAIPSMINQSANGATGTIATADGFSQRELDIAIAASLNQTQPPNILRNCLVAVDNTAECINSRVLMNRTLANKSDYSTVVTCKICFDRGVNVSSKCGHVFCVDCVRQFEQTSPGSICCPYCKFGNRNYCQWLYL